ncbi:asparagine synthase-related protein [Cohnella faecalis]|uniref:asparagine synthase (glutamine-hydrolyzing) n=1 Tax=Cohnella faecalis TaxID=2315694 RepID=A0A398CMA4_9BACL|nr:asparagine synthase-related protein [Cohnella faecalis]RIE03783.1 asparagine synthetase B [Cohnella faecalis]
MSAIVGIYQNDGESVPQDHGMGLMRALASYPSDDSRIWQHSSVFLGCHAQWITPESIGEILPCYDQQRQLAITADAILDNREELFEKLQVDRSIRKIIPDSQLILLAYGKWGDESPSHLVGDFAFMIWDEAERRLFGARDFSGNRTLYFARASGRFAFSTIIKPLFSLPYISNALNEQWLAEYLANPGRLETVDAGSTVHRQIEQLPPSHFISVTDGAVKISRYRTFEEARTLRLKNDGEYEEAFRDVFRTSVASRLRTFRQVGSFLSGGLDSGSVASFAAKALRRDNKQLFTYSAIPLKSFDDWTTKSRVADERPLIRSTVEHVGNIKDHYLDFEGKSPLTEMDEWLDTMEMPYKFVENSYWFNGIYETAKRNDVGVLLNGGRGNFTVSFGPALEYYVQLLKRLKWFTLHRELYLYSRNKGIGRRRLLGYMKDRLFPPRISPGDRSVLSQLIHPAFAERTQAYEKLQRNGIDLSGSAIPDMIHARTKQFEECYHWTNSGTSGTKLSLRHGMWYRDPTNDLRVIRFCLSVPIDQYVRDGMDRALIRRSTVNLLPDQIRLNYKTRGIQGADGIQRMAPAWKSFIREVDRLCEDREMAEWLNIPVVKAAASKYREVPDPRQIYTAEFTILMRSLIVYRFAHRLRGGE